MYALLLHFSTPLQVGRRSIRHHFALVESVGTTMSLIKRGMHPSRLVSWAANISGAKVEVGKVWKSVEEISTFSQFRDWFKRSGGARRHCKLCRVEREQQRSDTGLEKLLERSVQQAQWRKLKKPGWTDY